MHAVTQAETHRVPVSVVLFNVGYMIPSIATALWTGNGEFVFYCVVMVILFVALYAAHRRVGFTTATLWMLSIWGLLHMAGGLVPIPTGPFADSDRVTPTLYNLWFAPGYLRYDHLLHAFGFGVMTWVSYQGLRSIAGIVGPTVGVLLLSVAAALGFGALNELVEFIATLIMHDTNVGDFNNVGFDLMSNTAGALIAAVLLRLLDKQPSA